MKTKTTLAAPAEFPVKPSDRSTDGAVEINSIHFRICGCADEATLWAAVAGLLLYAKRAELPHGEWGPWVKANCGFTMRSASNYIACAERAVVALAGETGKVASAEELMSLEAVRDSAREDLLQWIGPKADGADTANRDALIESIRKPKPALPSKPAAQPKAPRTPRPPAPPTKIAHRYAIKVRKAPEPVRVALFTELRPEFEAWLKTQEQN